MKMNNLPKFQNGGLLKNALRQLKLKTSKIDRFRRFNPGADLRTRAGSTGAYTFNDDVTVPELGLTTGDFSNLTDYERQALFNLSQSGNLPDEAFNSLLQNFKHFNDNQIGHQLGNFASKYPNSSFEVMLPKGEKSALMDEIFRDVRNVHNGRHPYLTEDYQVELDKQLGADYYNPYSMKFRDGWTGEYEKNLRSYGGYGFYASNIPTMGASSYKPQHVPVSSKMFPVGRDRGYRILDGLRTTEEPLEGFQRYHIDQTPGYSYMQQISPTAHYMRSANPMGNIDPITNISRYRGRGEMDNQHNFLLGLTNSPSMILSGNQGFANLQGGNDQRLNWANAERSGRGKNIDDHLIDIAPLLQEKFNINSAIDGTFMKIPSSQTYNRLYNGELAQTDNLSWEKRFKAFTDHQPTNSTVYRPDFNIKNPFALRPYTSRDGQQFFDMRGMRGGAGEYYSNSGEFHDRYLMDKSLIRHLIEGRYDPSRGYKQGGEPALPKAQKGKALQSFLKPLKEEIIKNSLYRIPASIGAGVYDRLFSGAMEKAAYPHLLRGERFVDDWYADPLVADATENLFKNQYADPSPFTQFQNWGEYSNFINNPLTGGRSTQSAHTLKPFMDRYNWQNPSVQAQLGLTKRIGEGTDLGYHKKSLINPRVSNSAMWAWTGLNPNEFSGLHGGGMKYPINITRKGFQRDPQELFDVAAHEKSHWYVRGKSLVPVITNRWKDFVTDDAWKIIQESSKTGKHPEGYHELGDAYLQTPVEVQARITEIRGLLSDMGLNNAEILSLQTFGLSSIDTTMAQKIMDEIQATSAGEALFDTVLKDGSLGFGPDKEHRDLYEMRTGTAYKAGPAQRKAFDNLFNLMRYTPVLAAPIVGAGMLQEEELGEQETGGEIKKHTVLRGDNGKTLFEKYGVDAADIKEHNGIKFFKEGQEIKIPSRKLSKAQDGTETKTYTLNEINTLNNTPRTTRKQKETIANWKSPGGYTYAQLMAYNQNVTSKIGADAVAGDRSTWEGKQYGSPWNNSENQSLFTNSGWNPQSQKEAYRINRDLGYKQFFYNGEPFTTESKEELENRTPSQELIDFNKNIAQIAQEKGLYGESLENYIGELFPEGSRERNLLDTYEKNSGKGFYSSFIEDNKEDMHIESLYRDLDNATTDGPEAANTLLEQEAIMDALDAKTARIKNVAANAYSGSITGDGEYHDQGEIRQDYPGIPYNAQFLYDSAPGLAGNPAAQRKFATENPASPTNALAMAGMAAPILGGLGALSSIPLGAGFVAGDLINAGFAYNSLTNTLPQAATDLYDGNYLDALGNATIGGLELMGAPSTFRKGYKGLQNNINLFPKLGTQKAVNSLVPNAKTLNDYGLRTTENLSLSARELPAWSFSGKPNQIQARNYFRNNFNPADNTLVKSLQ